MTLYRNAKTDAEMNVTPGTALAEAVENDSDWVRVREAAAKSKGDKRGRKQQTPPPVVDDALGLKGLTHDELVARGLAVGVIEDGNDQNDAAVIEAIEKAVADADALGDDLADFDRKQLNIRAAAVGVVEPEGLPNKGAVVEAIEAAAKSKGD